MLTGISIHLNRDEYSRYEPARSVVKARIIPVPATGLTGEVVTVTIQENGVALATNSVTFNGDNPKGSIVEFDLNQIVDAAGIPHMSRGIYQVVATQEAVTATTNLKVSMITADEMRASYCQGLYLVSSQKLAPKRQPSVVTGIKITNVSGDTKKGVVALAYIASGNTVSWGGGVATPLTQDSDSEILIDTKGNYIEVDVDFYNLPGVDAAEGILLDDDSMSDCFIQGEIEKASREVENQLKVMLEPTRIATEPYFSNPDAGEYFDKPAVPLCYYEKDFNMRGLGWHLDLPYHQVLKVGKLEGFVGNTQALELLEGALTVNKKTGNVDVLPYNSAYTMYWTFFMGINFWGIREFIADFWRYKAIIGINEPDPSEILKLVGFTAAISILIVAEQSYRAGVTSQSNSKDGVSSSRSYSSTGVYDYAIKEYKEWVKTNTPRLRNLYRGIPTVVA